MQYIDKDDKLIVIQITTHGTVENITANTINWLKTNLN